MFRSTALRALAFQATLTVLVGLLPALLSAGPAVADPDPVGGWPLHPEPEVVHAFDPPSDPYGPGHRGVDLAGTIGQSVHAAMAGTITYAGTLAGRGVVVVNHGPTRTTYEPVAASVRVGDVVAQDDRIGSLELAGSHCFPAACLHWGWLRGDVYLNPLDLVGRQRVRLLPLYLALGQPFRAALPYQGWQPLIALFHAVERPTTHARSP
jgi:murein DD-endopeptidase MepM/ murein hydrolase activator NlpD